MSGRTRSGKPNLAAMALPASTPAPIVMHGFDDSETITLAAGQAHERIVIDVPPNATGLHVTTSGSGEVDLYVAKATATPTPPAFAAAPARGQAQGTSIHAGATEAVTVAFEAPRPTVTVEAPPPIALPPYDIVAVVEVPNLTDVPSVISRHIRAVDGIESTTTCVTFPEAG